MALLNSFIHRIIAEKQITQADLCAALKIKSENTLTRVFNLQARRKALLNFESLFIQSGLLTSQEIQELHSAISIRIDGFDTNDSYAQLTQFICGSSSAAFAPIMVRKNGEICDVSSYMQHANKITIINCVFPGLGITLKDAIENGTTVLHFVRKNNSLPQYLNLLNQTNPLLPLNNYCLSFFDDMIDNGLGMTNAMIIEKTVQTERVCTELVIFNSQQNGIVLPGDDGLKELLPIKQVPAKRLSSNYNIPGSFFDFCKTYAKIEKDATIFDLKPDPCVMLIPVKILADAFMEGALPPSMKSIDQFTALYNLFRERNLNIEEKHAPTYCVMQYDALKLFAQTGVLTDHLRGMRPFTAKERSIILKNLLDMSETNHYFNLYLWNDAAVRQCRNLCVYDNRGMYIASKTGDYLGNNFSEAFLQMPDEFYDIFKRYFHDVLLENHVLSSVQTKRMITHLIKTYCSE